MMERAVVPASTEQLRILVVCRMWRSSVHCSSTWVASRDDWHHDIEYMWSINCLLKDCLLAEVVRRFIIQQQRRVHGVCTVMLYFVPQFGRRPRSERAVVRAETYHVV